jgi:anti-sigma factor RsiW
MRTTHEASMAHPAAALLPWYLTGTLKESERRTVDKHLATCAECRAELESLAQLRVPLRTAWAEEPTPVLHVKPAVMAQVQADRAARHLPNRTASDHVVGNAVEQWFRNLFAPRWVPALAATLLIGQLALLLWTAGPHSSPPPDHVTTRGIPAASVHVTVLFQESASEARIRATILDLKGRLVDGPTTDGVYTIAIPVAESAALDSQMARLKQQPDLIRRVERVLR